MNIVNIKPFLNDYIRKVGLRFYSLILICDFDKTIIYSNRNKNWEKEFLTKNMDVNSDIINFSKNKSAPFLWSIKDIKNEELISISSDYQISYGATFIIRNSFNTVLFTIYKSNETENFNDLFLKKKSEIQMDLLEFFDDMIFIIPGILSKQEKKVIDLLKTGKTYQEVSASLNIKERTVRYHIENITIKLNVTSLKHAIFKAAKF